MARQAERSVRVAVVGLEEGVSGVAGCWRVG